MNRESIALIHYSEDPRRRTNLAHTTCLPWEAKRRLWDNPSQPYKKIVCRPNCALGENKTNDDFFRDFGENVDVLHRGIQKVYLRLNIAYETLLY
jgi:hypothetical protein